MEKKQKSKKWKAVKIVVIILISLILLLALAWALLLGILGGIGPLGFIRRNKIKNHHGNNEQYSLVHVAQLPASPLSGMHIAFLGSSVTAGDGSLEVSFVEYLSRRNAFTYVKEAVSGTTLVDTGEGSYIQRMENNIDVNERFDLFVCQLSTNDATQNLPLGGIASSTQLSDFDTQTITGAIEYITAYVYETWGCPVVFYTGTKYESEQYEAMVDTLLQLQVKWGIGVIDFWNNQGMNAVDEADYKVYMLDSIHPTQAGYLAWWTPAMEDQLYQFVEDTLSQE